MEKRALLHCWRECELVQPLESSLGRPQNTGDSCARSSNPVPGYIPQASDLKTNRIVLCLWLAAAAAALLLCGGWPILVGAAISLLLYCCVSKHEFGGITGDLAGWFVQICELVCLSCMVLAEKGVALL